ncbi:MAG: NUDIX hydrolase, partial [Hyphomonadaceae bacterium]
ALKDRWIDVRADACVREDGVRLDPYYVLRYPDWVHVACFDGAGRLCLVDQYRHGAGKVVRELPGGMLEEGETPEEGAARELREEAGLSGVDWRYHGAYSPNPATHSNMIHIFSCHAAGEAAVQTLDETEEINAYFATPEEIAGFVEDGSYGQLSHIGILHRLRMAGLF